MQLTTPVTDLKGVGEKVAIKLAQINLHTVKDVLLHLPNRFEDRTRLIPIGMLKQQEFALVEGRVVDHKIQYGRRRSLLCTIEDSTGILQLRFFYFNAGLIHQLSQADAMMRCFGTTRVSKVLFEMVHPEFQIIGADKIVPLEKSLTPVYPSTAGVSQSLLRKLIRQCLDVISEQSLELLPAEILRRISLPSLEQSILSAHLPAPGESVNLQRLAFEELLVHHCRLKQVRLLWQQDQAIQMPKSKKLLPALLKILPYQLTGAQQRVVQELSFDLAKDKPMLRLVQGDVGSGKTVVAFAAALIAIEAGTQVCLMAPTEILAEQHYQNFLSWCDSLDIKIAWLTGSTPAKQRITTLQELQAGITQIIVGTHALFQADVHYRSLSLVIIDEQHRFGVQQRATLVEKGKIAGMVPHRLVMTATPIPRSLAMTAYADLDCSVIDELPPGRTPVATVAIDNTRRAEVIVRVQQNCQFGQQVYWVCTLIEESEQLQCQAAEKVLLELQAALPEQSVGLVHGKMKSSEKDLIMKQFKRGELDVLVATTVIEVGVDVPNASLMVIENPERLGLSQLHQLRGRVGRGSAKSVCVLLYQGPLSFDAKERLNIMRKTNDGFEIAQKDLMMRGPGELLGARQSGIVAFRFADLLRDQALIPKVQSVADELMRDYPATVAQLVARWSSHEE